MREITDHHDGHGLTENLRIIADDPGPGGASHYYAVASKQFEELEDFFEATDDEVLDPTTDPLTIVSFQKGPRHDPNSTPGIVESVLLAIVGDRMKSFQAGPYACSENGEVLEHVNAALAALKKRADARAARGVLGTYKK